jgi:hypothetical protein
MQQTSKFGSEIENERESSTIDWSQVGNELAVDLAKMNREMFQNLRSHAKWGNFFLPAFLTKKARTLGSKIAEGA